MMMLAASELLVQLPRYTETHAMYFRHSMNKPLLAPEEGVRKTGRLTRILRTGSASPRLTKTVEIAPGLSDSAT